MPIEGTTLELRMGASLICLEIHPPVKGILTYRAYLKCRSRSLNDAEITYARAFVDKYFQGFKVLLKEFREGEILNVQEVLN